MNSFVSLPRIRQSFGNLTDHRALERRHKDKNHKIDTTNETTN